MKIKLNILGIFLMFVPLFAIANNPANSTTITLYNDGSSPITFMLSKGKPGFAGDWELNDGTTPKCVNYKTCEMQSPVVLKLVDTNDYSSIRKTAPNPAFTIYIDKKPCKAVILTNKTNELSFYEDESCAHDITKGENWKCNDYTDEQGANCYFDLNVITKIKKHHKIDI